MRAFPTSIATATLALGLLLAGCLAKVPPDPSPAGDGPAMDLEPLLDSLSRRSLADPEGDATDLGAGDAATLAGCTAGQVAGETCLEAPADPPRAGTPGPHYDILALSLEGETANHLVVALQIARLSEGFEELANPDGFIRMNYYTVCWAATAEGACDRSIRLDVMRHGTSVHADAKFEIRNRQCNEWSWCSWGIPSDIRFGAPATLSFHVPKAYLTADGAPLALHHMEAQTGWVSEPSVLPAWHPGLTAHTPAYHFHTHAGAVSGLNVADVTQPLRVDQALAPPTTTGWPSSGAAPLLVGGEGANHGASSPYNYPEMDLLSFDLYEDGPDLVAAFAVREMRALPTYDFDYSVGVGIGRQVWEIGYRHEGHARGESHYYGYAGRCIMEMCQDGKVMTPVVETALGSPGLITIRTPLAFIGDPADGTATNLFWAMTMYSDYNLYWGAHDEPIYGDVHSVFEIDSLRGGGYPFVFGSGHRAQAPAAHAHG